MVYCLDSHRLLAADDRMHVFTTGFRTYQGINYPIAVRKDGQAAARLAAVREF